MTKGRKSDVGYVPALPVHVRGGECQRTQNAPNLLFKRPKYVRSIQLGPKGKAPLPSGEAKYPSKRSHNLPKNFESAVAGGRIVLKVKTDHQQAQCHGIYSHRRQHVINEHRLVFAPNGVCCCPQDKQENRYNDCYVR